MYYIISCVHIYTRTYVVIYSIYTYMYMYIFYIQLYVHVYTYIYTTRSPLTFPQISSLSYKYQKLLFLNPFHEIFMGQDNNVSLSCGFLRVR